LGEILSSELQLGPFPDLIVGNQSSDDAAVYDIGDGKAIISTTDFFMPIVDDAFDFGRIASCNAISDIYAMGGKPLMAIAILGWPANKIPAKVASKMLDGGRAVCAEAGIPLAGGHSIDSPEPIFGLAVTGVIHTDKIKRNDTATSGDKIFLTKKLGIGILTTAQKQKKISTQDMELAVKSMSTLNTVGQELSRLKGLSAMTDVTGFGLAGHLLEVCLGSHVSAEINFSKLPVFEEVEKYRQMGCIPGGTHRNHDSIKEHLGNLSEEQIQILCDPQTSGGLLVTVCASQEKDFLALCHSKGLDLEPFGVIKDWHEGPVISVTN